MRTLGFVLIIAGIVMIFIRGFAFTTEKKVIDAGPIQVNKKENKWIGWPTYAGAVICIAGAALVFGSKKNS
jgi:uncharacterized membrane protein